MKLFKNPVGFKDKEEPKDDYKDDERSVINMGCYPAEEDDDLRNSFKVGEREKMFQNVFKYGMTVVAKYKGTFFFWGDVSTYGIQAIVLNAMKIRETMMENTYKLGVMKYNDFPEYNRKYSWNKLEKIRENYGSELYSLEGNKFKEVS